MPGGPKDFIGAGHCNSLRADSDYGVGQLRNSIPVLCLSQWHEGRGTAPFPVAPETLGTATCSVRTGCAREDHDEVQHPTRVLVAMSQKRSRNVALSLCSA